MATKDKHKKRSGVTYSDKRKTMIYGMTRMRMHNRSTGKRG